MWMKSLLLKYINVGTSEPVVEVVGKNHALHNPLHISLQENI